jgi:hypothetical protein
MMKLRIEELPLGFGFRCINDNEYDGAEDAGPQMVGEGKTAEEAKADFMDQWMEREAERDMKAAVRQMRVWDSFLDQMFGSKR